MSDVRTRLRHRLLAGLGIALLAFAVFDIPSAFASWRGAPWWLALAIGLVVFPIAPLAWHVLGERTRARVRAAAKKPAKSTTTAWDRLALRAGAVGLGTIAALVGFGGGHQLLYALHHRALWFVPRAEPTLATDSPLFGLVPKDAELVAWLRPTADWQASLGETAREQPALTETVIAADLKRPVPDLAVITRGDQELLDLPSVLRGAPVAWRPAGLDPTPTTTDDGLTWRASPAWKPAIGGGAPRELLAEAHGIPADAIAVVLAAPRAPGDVTGVVAYLRPQGPQVELVVDVETVSPRTALRLAAGPARALVGKHGAARLAVCLAEHGGTMTAWPEGTLVRVRAQVAVVQLRGLVGCL